MTLPELHVEAWFSAQDAYFAATSGNGSEQNEQDSSPVTAEPAAADPPPALLPDDFWQDWFGLWR